MAKNKINITVEDNQITISLPRGTKLNSFIKGKGNDWIIGYEPALPARSRSSNPSSALKTLPELALESELSVRARVILKKHADRFQTLDDITAENMKNIKNCGPCTRQELLQWKEKMLAE